MNFASVFELLRNIAPNFHLFLTFCRIRNEQDKKSEHLRQGVYIKVNDLRKAELDAVLRSLSYGTVIGVEFCGKVVQTVGEYRLAHISHQFVQKGYIVQT